MIKKKNYHESKTINNFRSKITLWWSCLKYFFGFIGYFLINRQRKTKIVLQESQIFRERKRKRNKIRLNNTLSFLRDLKLIKAFKVKHVINPAYGRPWISWRVRIVTQIKYLKKKLYQVSYVSCHVSRVMCHISRVACYLSLVTCCMLPVACHMSLTPTATATDPPHANSSTLHSRMVCKDPQKNLFSAGQFRTISEQKLLNLRPRSFHFSYVRNLFVIDHLTFNLCNWDWEDVQ